MGFFKAQQFGLQLAHIQDFGNGFHVNPGFGGFIIVKPIKMSDFVPDIGNFV